MTIEDFVEKILNGESVTFELPDSIDLYIDFLWDDSVEAAAKLPKEIKLIELDDRNLQKEINDLITDFNNETVRQKTLYLDLFKHFLEK